MSDLISRQAAQRLFGKALTYKERNGKLTWTTSEVKQWIADCIEQLPPAQPESNYDEWCTDCKEYDHENSCCPRWTKVIRQTRRELQDEFVMTAVDGTLWVTVDEVQKVGRVIVDEDKSKFCRQFYMDAQPEQRWIPVTERLPEEDDYRPCYGYEDGAVWWRNDMGLMGLGWYYPSTGNWAYYDESDRCEKCVGNVVEWMPLPKWEGDAE